MIDPKQLQSLVDGECTPSERRALLTQIDSEPDQWRTLALSLLEEQIFSREIAALSKEPQINQPVPTPVMASSMAYEPRVGRFNQLLHWAPALAAGLIVAFGMYSGRLWNQTGSVDVAGNHTTGSLLPNSSNKTGSRINQLATQKSNSEYEAGLPFADLRVTTDRGEIPIYDAQQIDPAWVMAKHAYDMQLANEKLRKSGYEVNMEHEYVTGELHDGRRLVVPIQKVGLRPTGQ